MKKILVLLTIVATMSFGGTAFASSSVADCAVMSNGKHVALCAQKMNKGVSQCATSDCQMTNCSMIDQ